MKTEANRQRWVGLLLVLLGALGFSAKAIFIKLAYAAASDLDAITLMALRMLFSLPFFLLVAIGRQPAATHARLTGRQWLVVTGLGLIGYYVASYLDFLGLQHISAGLERVILFSYPTFVVLFSALWLKRPLTRRTGWALLLSYGGLLLVFAEQVTFSTPGLWLGSALVLASAVVFAVFTMGSGVMTPRIGSTRFTAYTMTVASIATLLHFIAQKGWLWPELPLEVFALVALMAVFSTVLPSFMMNAGILRIGAGAASVVSTIGPILTLVLAYSVLGEAITAAQVAGTGLVLAGVYLMGKKS